MSNAQPFGPQPPRARKIATAFVVLFVSYQIPEGVGLRLLGSFELQALLLLLFFVVAYLTGRAFARPAIAAYALEHPTRALRITGAAFCFAILAKIVTVVIGVRCGFYEMVHTSNQAVVSSLLAGLAITFAPSLAEDIVTRGFWFRAAGIGSRATTFVIISTAIYVLNHVYRLALGPGEWTMLFAFGLAYSCAVVRYRSLWPAVGLHWGWNYGNALVDVVQPVMARSVSGTRILAIAAHAAMVAFILMASHPADRSRRRRHVGESGR